MWYKTSRVGKLQWEYQCVTEMIFCSFTRIHSTTHGLIVWAIVDLFTRTTNYWDNFMRGKRRVRSGQSYCTNIRQQDAAVRPFPAVGRQTASVRCRECRTDSHHLYPGSCTGRGRSRAYGSLRRVAVALPVARCTESEDSCNRASTRTGRRACACMSGPWAWPWHS